MPSADLPGSSHPPADRGASGPLGAPANASPGDPVIRPGTSKCSQTFGSFIRGAVTRSRRGHPNGEDPGSSGIGVFGHPGTVARFLWHFSLNPYSSHASGPRGRPLRRPFAR